MGTPGSFVLVPGGVTHDFENRGATRAGVLNVSVPGDFESEMPGIAQRFAEHPPENATYPDRSSPRTRRWIGSFRDARRTV